MSGFLCKHVTRRAAPGLLLAAVWALSSPVLWADEKPDKPKDRPRKQAELRLRIIEASSAPQAKNDAASLVPEELKSLLRYSHYSLVDSGYIRGQEDKSLEIVVAGNLKGDLRFRASTGTAAPEIVVDVQIAGPPNSEGKTRNILETTVSAKNGETVVLGASNMRGGGSALIVLLTVKLLP